MNENLLDEALAIPNIRAYFLHKVTSVDFDKRVMVVQDLEAQRDAQVSFDLCVGADGSYSVVRRQLMRVVRYVVPYRVFDNVIFPFDFSADCFLADMQKPRTFHSMDYQQEYIPHEYLELKMPAGPPAAASDEPSFLLDPNHLHIWPRHTFMLIALPNKVRFLDHGSSSFSSSRLLKRD